MPWTTLKLAVFSHAVSKTRHPHSSTWFHPESTDDRPPANENGKWNLLYHLGGNGPWIQKVDGVLEGGIGPPPQCRVEQVHMVIPPRR
jgi:acid phosphatase